MLLLSAMKVIFISLLSIFMISCNQEREHSAEGVKSITFQSKDFVSMEPTKDNIIEWELRDYKNIKVEDYKSDVIITDDEYDILNLKRSKDNSYTYIHYPWKAYRSQITGKIILVTQELFDYKNGVIYINTYRPKGL